MSTGTGSVDAGRDGQQTVKRDYTSGAGNGYEASLGAGDEGVGSPTLSRKRINNPCHSALLASSASAQNIGGGAGVPVYIKGITIMEPLTASATVTIAGLSTPSATAALATTYVVDDAVLASVEYPWQVFPPGVARAFAAGCQITCSTAGDGLKIIVDWEAIP